MFPRDDRDRPSPDDATDRDETAGRRTGFVGSLVPTGLACRFLAYSLEVPETFTVGRQTPFRFHVKNRAPVPLVLELPSSRPWGWSVDDVAEAGTGRFDPPSASARLAFGPRERRTFTGRWDGQFRETEAGEDRWTPVPGERTLVAYLAVENWTDRRAYASATVRVV